MDRNGSMDAAWTCNDGFIDVDGNCYKSCLEPQEDVITFLSDVAMDRIDDFYGQNTGKLIELSNIVEECCIVECLTSAARQQVRRLLHEFSGVGHGTVSRVPLLVAQASIVGFATHLLQHKVHQREFEEAMRAVRLKMKAR